jgi:hypothetical protein
MAPLGRDLDPAAGGSYIRPPPETVPEMLKAGAALGAAVGFFV